MRFRRTFVIGLLALGLAALPPGRSAGAGESTAGFTPLVKSHDEWRKLQSPDRYRILFDEETEHAGTFVCAACFMPLFEQLDLLSQAGFR